MVKEDAETKVEKKTRLKVWLSGLGDSWRESGAGGRVIAVFLVFVVLGGAAFLVMADPPWDSSYVRRKAEGKTLRGIDYAVFYDWFAAVANMLIALVGLATAKWWMTQDMAEDAGVGRLTSWRGGGRFFWGAIIAALLVAAVWRAPRLTHSFWNDEAYAARLYSWGCYIEKEDGSLERKQPDWATAIFDDRKMNNHIEHSIESRIALALRGDRDSFRESTFRIEPFINGLVTIGGLALLGAACGVPRVGLIAAFLMALSPWHVRYSVEARGYSEMLAALVVSWICLVRAIEKRRWRWWIGYALAQAMVLLGNLAPLWGIVVTNVMVGVYLAWRWSAKRERRPFTRWVVSCSLSVMLLMPFLLPVIPQVMEYERTGGGRDPGAPMNAEWLRDYASHLIAGVPVAEDWVLIVAGMALVFGLILALARGSLLTLLTASGVLIGGVLGFFQLRANSAPAFGWYLLYTLLPVIYLIAWSTDWRGRLRTAGGVFGVVLVLGYAGVTWDTRLHLAVTPRQPMREAVAAMRGESPAFSETDEGILTGVFGVSDGMLRLYDPRVRRVKEPDAMQALIAEAKASQKTLRIAFAGKDYARKRDPECYEIVVESGNFERIADLPGLEEMFSYEVWELAE